MKQSITEGRSQKMNKYEIWSEGCMVQGMDSPAKASLVAVVEAESFQEACDKHFEGNYCYNRRNLTHWGCRLYDNEAAARASFG